MADDLIPRLERLADLLRNEQSQATIREAITKIRQLQWELYDRNGPFDAVPPPDDPVGREFRKL